MRALGSQGLAGLGLSLGRGFWGWVTLGCDPRGSKNPSPSDLASPTPHCHPRGEKAAVFLLPSGLSRSQQV